MNVYQVFNLGPAVFNELVILVVIDFHFLVSIFSCSLFWLRAAGQTQLPTP